MWTTLVLAVVLAAAAAWSVRESRLANFQSPARTWLTLVAFWRSGSAVAVRSCLTPESLALIDYILDRALPEPAVPPELLDYLTRDGAEKSEVYRRELTELLKLVRTNVEKFWFGARPRDPKLATAPDARRTELGLLRHIMSGLPDDPEKPAPRVRQVLDTFQLSAHEYARVVYDPMFAGFGLVDTYKRTGRIWLLDLTAPLLEAAHASKTQFMPGEVMKVTDRVMMVSPEEGTQPGD